jgi:hypothetical protein
MKPKGSLRISYVALLRIANILLIPRNSGHRSISMNSRFKGSNTPITLAGRAADPHRPHPCNDDRKVGRSCGLIDIKQSLLVMNTGLVGSDASLGGAALAHRLSFILNGASSSLSSLDLLSYSS